MRNKKKYFISVLWMLFVFVSSKGQPGMDANKIRLVVLDPGHFHAALIQKSKLPEIDSNVRVYAPDNADVYGYLKLVQSYNSRQEDPTFWKEKVYLHNDYLQKMVQEKAGNLLILAGNNQKKTEYIQAGIQAGMNVLSDKPMVISSDDFKVLKQAFGEAEKKNLIVYDIMTERYALQNIVIKELLQMKDLVGAIRKGTPEQPAISMESVHYFFKTVSGSVLVRPSWFFDVRQQGYGIADVTTHLVDIVQWFCYPEKVLDDSKDVKIIDAKIWPTVLTKDEFTNVTQTREVPEYLQKDMKDGLLSVLSNGSLSYRLKDHVVSITDEWKYKAEEGGGDTHTAVINCSNATIMVQQGKEQGYKPVLYISPARGTDAVKFERLLKARVPLLNKKHPGTSVKKTEYGWQLILPEKENLGHESYFTMVAKKMIEYVHKKKLPEWERSYMLTKYYTLMEALRVATNK